ncbi:MAG: 4Fe-4S binding protein [Coriobacteriia bacterium]|nr:4Fe-4S binding protein [Coriobacteriia bacterium]
MVTLDEASNIMFKLAGAVPAIEPARCTKVRHKLSRCSACVDACPTGALSVEDNEIVVDKTICLGCGTCSVACPTQALTSKTSTHSFNELIEVSLNSDYLDSTETEQTNKVLWLACSKHQLAKLGSRHLEAIPCIGALDEAQLIHFAAKGIDELRLLTNSCESCPLASAGEYFCKTYRGSQELASKWGLTLIVQHIQEENGQESAFPYLGDGYSRRGFFGSVKQELQKSSLAVAESAIEQHFDEQREKMQWRTRLLNEEGTALKRFSIPRNDAILDALYSAERQPAQTETIQPRFAGRLNINHNLCTDCGLCAFFCTTGTLKKLGKDIAQSVARNADNKNNSEAQNTSCANATTPAGAAPKPATHEFRACDCAQCYLCVDACPNHAIKLDRELSVAELFELEPQAI